MKLRIPNPHPHVHADTNLPVDDSRARPAANRSPSGSSAAFSRWATGSSSSLPAFVSNFTCSACEQPRTVLASLHPTFWWGVCLLLFGLFYTVKFRPGKA